MPRQRGERQSHLHLPKILARCIRTHAECPIRPIENNGAQLTCHHTQPFRLICPMPKSPNPLNVDLPRKVRHFLSKLSDPLHGEPVRAVAGTSPQVLIATDNRLAVVKVGFLAGSTGGGRFTDFSYQDITTIQVQLGIMMGSLSVQSPGYGATQTGDYWAQGKQQDPLQLPNVIPWSKADDRKYAAELSWIRTRISEARHPSEPGRPAALPSTDLIAQLERLSQLHTQGHLTDDEFRAAKAQLLESTAIQDSVPTPPPLPPL